MTAHVHSEADGALAAVKALGFKIRQIPGTGEVSLEAWKRTKFMGGTTTVTATRHSLHEAALALLEAVRGK